MPGPSFLQRSLDRLRRRPVMADTPALEVEPAVELQALFAAMTDRVVVVDREGRYVRVAQTGGNRLFDNDPSVVGRTIADVRTPEIAAHITAAVNEALDTGKPVTVEIPFRGDWGERWLSGVFSPLTADTTVAVIRDVTETIEAKQELERQRDALSQEVKERTAAQDELRALFAAMTDRVIVVNRDFQFLRVQETNAPERLLEHTRSQIERPLGTDIDHDAIARLQAASLRESIDERKPVSFEYPLQVGADTFWMAAVASPLSPDSALLVIRDVTETVEAKQELEQQRDALAKEVKERTQAQNDLRALFAAMTDRVVVLDRDGRYLRIPQTSAGESQIEPDSLLGQRLHDSWSKARADMGVAAIRRCIETQTPETIEYQLDPPNEAIWMAAAISPLPDGTVLAVVRDISERVHAQTRLEARVEERTRELTAMLDTSHDISSMMDIAPLLQIIIDRVKDIADYDRCSIYQLEGDDLTLLGSRVGGPGNAPIARLTTARMDALWTQLAQGEVVIIEDIRGDTEMAAAYRRASGDLLETASRGMRSWMGVPLISKEQVVGMLALSHSTPAFYTEHYARLVLAIANQAAISIENAQLHSKTLELATMQERQRLARELHDSVSQALYGIALGAQTARTMIPDDAPVLEPVKYVLSLAEAGMAEMRALIFELRPESLEVEGLVSAFQKQILALTARYQIAIDGQLGREPSLSLPHKEVFYRIGQEALHNMVKHAKATEATVFLNEDEERCFLEVTDNGTGFDTRQNFPGHIGLVSMSERAASIGAKLEVISKPGSGTTIRLTRENAGP